MILLNLKDTTDGVIQIPIRPAITEEITEEVIVTATMMTAIESLMIYDKMRYLLSKT
jgi:hypothetical protein